MSEPVLLARRVVTSSGRNITAEVYSRGNFVVLQCVQDDGEQVPHVALSLSETHKILSRFSRAGGEDGLTGAGEAMLAVLGELP